MTSIIRAPRLIALIAAVLVVGAVPASAGVVRGGTIDVGRGAAGPGAASAAAVTECSYAEGGGFHNLTTRNVPCSNAKRVAKRVLHNVSPCWGTEAKLGRCTYTRGGWRVHGRWFKDRYGNHQLDLRSTASGRRVVRIQTDWDGE
jgi:hypothetical protein